MESENKDKNTSAFSPHNNPSQTQNSFFESNPNEEHLELQMMDSKNNQLIIESPVIVNKNNQPCFQCNVSLAVNSKQIAKVFLSIAEQFEFIPIEHEKDEILVLQKNKVTLKNFLMSCMFNQQIDEKLSAVKLNISTNTNKCTRKIVIKGLHGDNNLNKQLIAEFKQHIEKNKHQTPQNPNQSQHANDDTLYDEGFIQQKQIDSDEEDNFNNNPFTLESTANYMFQKILSATQYGLGKKCHEYFTEFEGKYEGDENVNTGKMMEQTVNLINEIVESLFSDYNYGKEDTKTIMPYCKISVEKYIFQKLHSNMVKIYKNKYIDKEQIFNEKRIQIQEKLSIKEIFKFLDPHVKFWLIEGISEKVNNKKEIQITPENEQKAINLIDDENKPYSQAISELQKIESCQSPREKLKCIMMMRSMMRGAVIDFHKGKEEIVSQDDEIPVVIYIVLMSRIKSIYSELAIVEDFINQDSTIESEKRLLISLQVSAQYVSQEWKLE